MKETNNEIEAEFLDQKTLNDTFNAAFNNINEIKKIDASEKESINVTPAEALEETQIPVTQQTSNIEHESTTENTEEKDDTSLDDLKSDEAIKKDRLWEVKREKYKLLKEKELLAQENQQLRDQVSQAIESSVHYYNKNVYTELEKAKSEAKQAIEEGNADAYIEANIKISQAVNAISELENIKARSRPQTTTINNNQPSQYDSAYATDIINDWFDTHPNLHPKSKTFNEDLANETANYIDALDKALKDNNRQDLYLSQEYFDTIDNYIHKYQAKKPAPTSTQQAPVGRVTAVAASSAAQAKPLKVILTAADKAWAKNWGLTEEQYLKSKIEIAKQNKQAN